MNPVSEFFVTHFALLCIAIGLIVISIQNIKIKKHDSIMSLCIVGITLILSMLWYIERLCRADNNMIGSVVTSYLGYVIRPLVVYFFTRLAEGNKKTKWYILIPLAIPFFVYAPALFIGNEALRTAVFYYVYNAEGYLSFARGSVLCFCSHVISAFYMGYLIYISIIKLKGKHFGDAMAILICAAFTVAAVVVESVFSDININLLNVTIMVGALFYNFYLFMEFVRSDSLTGLFDRKTYYQDIEKLDKQISAFVMLDMNGLKFINDNYGHLEGDKAITTIAHTLEEVCSKKCYGYRLGGDEFAVIIINAKEDYVIDVFNELKSALNKLEYKCSLGYAYREKNSSVTIDELIKNAEKEMYEDKARYYKESGIERRRT